jgi:hypothetical protein
MVSLFTTPAELSSAKDKNNGRIQQCIILPEPIRRSEKLRHPIEYGIE